MSVGHKNSMDKVEKVRNITTGCVCVCVCMTSVAAMYSIHQKVRSLIINFFPTRTIVVYLHVLPSIHKHADKRQTSVSVSWNDMI